MTEEHEGEEPLRPAFPFNEPGGDLVLHEGSLGEQDGQDLPGQVLLRCGSGLRTVWRLDAPPPTRWPMETFDESGATVRVVLPAGAQDLAGLQRNSTEGSVRGQTVGDDAAPLSRVLVHWINLPRIHSPTVLYSERDGSKFWFTGRWRFELGLWHLTLDAREDHSRVWDILGRDQNFVMTHVMEIVRTDGQKFTGADLELLLQTLHFGMSFAFGRWVCPAVPVGYDPSDVIRWQQWGDLFCEPGHKGGLAWLYYSYTHHLHELLSCVYAAFTDPDRANTIRLLLAMATEANNTGRVEQRTTTVFSALELLSWVELKLTRQFSNNQYKTPNTDGRIRLLLQDASVDTAIDAGRQPVLMQFATDESTTGVPLDGPAAVNKVRNRIVHPNSPHDEIYHLKGLATDVWLLSRQYLNLLILHWLDYKGSYQSVLGPGGWVGDSDPVPWSTTPKA